MWKRIRNGFPWFLGIALLLWLLWLASPAQVWAALQTVTAAEAAALMLLNGLVLLTLNGRWWLIVRGLGCRLPFSVLLGHRLAAFGVSYFTPGPHFGGEPVQVLLLEQHDVPRTAAVASVVLDKTLELLINFTFLAGGVLLVLRSRLFGALVGVEAAVFAGALLTLPLLLLALLWRGGLPISRALQSRALQAAASQLPRAWQPRLQPLLAGVRRVERQASRFCRRAPQALAGALLISILSWLLLMAEFWLMLTFLGLSLTWMQLIGLLVAARVAILLPLPAGLGSLEASQLLALSALGLNPAIGISAALLIRARDLCLGLLGLYWGVRRLPAMARWRRQLRIGVRPFTRAVPVEVDK